MTIVYRIRPTLSARLVFYSAIFTIYFVYTGGKFDHNDFMNAAAPMFEGRLYEQVHYVQAPLSFYFLKTLSYAAPDGHIYAALRLSSIFLSYIAILIVAETCFSLGWVKMVFTLLGATNLYYASSSFEIGSYALPIFFIASALAILLRTGQSIIGAFLGGLLFGLAGCTKLNHVLFVVPAFFFVLLGSGLSRRSVLNAAALSLGSVIGSGLIIFHLVSNAESFLSHNLYFHSQFMNAARGLDFKGSVRSVLSVLKDWLSSGGIYLVALSGLGLYRAFKGDMAERSGYVFVLSLLLISFPVAFSPAIGFKQYYVPVSFFAVLCFAFALQNEVLRVEKSAVAGLWFLTVGLLFQQVANVAPGIYSSLKEGLTTVEVKRINDALHASLVKFDKKKCAPKLFTFSGAFAIDSTVVLSEFTEGGMFWARLSGFVPENVISNPRYSISKDLLNPEAFVEAGNNVNLVMLGYYPNYNVKERALRTAAQTRGFELLTSIDTRLARQPLEVWANPACFD
jgi:hypothetical protein